MKNNQSLDAMQRRYESLKKRLGNIGLVLQGTITQRNIVRDDPEKPGRKKVLGPYYQWTFKEKGKTTTVNLTASQANIYQKAINNYRKMIDISRKMINISLEICEKSTIGVKKRKSKKMRQ